MEHEKKYKGHCIKNEEYKEACKCALEDVQKKAMKKGKEKVKQEMMKQFGFDMTLDLSEMVKQKEKKQKEKREWKEKKGYKLITFDHEQKVYIKEKGRKMYDKCRKQEHKKPVKCKKRIILKKCEPKKEDKYCSKEDHLAKKLVTLYRRTKFKYRVACYANEKWQKELDCRSKGYPKHFRPKGCAKEDADEYIKRLFKNISKILNNPKFFPKKKNEDFPKNFEKIASKVLRMILKAKMIIYKNCTLKERLAEDYLEKDLKLAVYLGCKFNILFYNEKKWNLSFVQDIEMCKADYRRACHKHGKDDDDKMSYY